MPLRNDDAPDGQLGRVVPAQGIGFRKAQGGGHPTCWRTDQNRETTPGLESIQPATQGRLSLLCNRPVYDERNVTDLKLVERIRQRIDLGHERERPWVAVALCFVLDVVDEQRVDRQRSNARGLRRSDRATAFDGRRLVGWRDRVREPRKEGREHELPSDLVSRDVWALSLCFHASMSILHADARAGSSRGRP